MSLTLAGLSEKQYSIGEAASLASMTTHAIRKWEDRYQAIAPARSAGGDRRYSGDQLTRLILLKNLVDSGRNIGSIASLSTDQLQQMCAQSLVPGSLRSTSSHGTWRVGVIGESIPALFTRESGQRLGLHPIAVAVSSDRLGAKFNSGSLDLLVLERATLDETVVDDLQQLRKQTGVQCIVVLYGFATRAHSLQLSTADTACLRMPVNYREVERVAETLLNFNEARESQTEPVANRYSRRTLARVAAMSPSIACECPHHLAELISALSNFEVYCSQCESNSPQDAFIHHYLRLTATQTRAAFESALATVAAHERIPIDQWQLELDERQSN